jgi:hypothetical protein
MSFSGWDDTLSMLQEHASLSMNTILQQNRWLPEEGRKASQNGSMCVQERSRFKSYVDKSFADLKN